MSIRMHVMLGWALSNIEEDDPRINWDALNSEKLEETTIEEYARYARAHSKELDPWAQIEGDQLSNIPENSVYFYECINLDESLGVLCITVPREVNSWVRYADDIDHAIANLDQEMFPRIDYLLRNPFPYDLDILVNGRPPREGILPQNFKMWEHMYQAGTLNDGLSLELIDQTIVEAEKSITPKVPQEIGRFVRYFDIFTDSEIYHTLRPALLRTWK